jgi:Tol biopolymer transport system component/DNA-binding winged helix-turn-helix (wHTH) protein
MTSNPSSIHRRYSFGPYTLDAVRRLLWREGTLVPLTPKTVDVLAVLIERHGEVVEKDDLLRFVWPNAVVEENNLARHVSTLRKALQQRRGQHDFISTIPGRGYMFVSPVVEVDEIANGHAIMHQPNALEAVGPAAVTAVDVSTASDGLASPELAADGHGGTKPPSFVRITMTGVAASLILAAATGAVIYSSRGAEVRRSRPELRQLTFDPGVQRDPTWSPDGTWLAYAADGGGNMDLYRRSLADPTPVRLTSAPEDESQPDWSPDGQWIAFRSETDGGGIYVMPASGGAARRVAAFGFYPRWSPDGSRILIRGSMLRAIDSAVFVVGRDGSGTLPVRPDLLKEFRAPYVAWHPDGKRVSIWGRYDRSKWSFVTAAIEGQDAVISPLAPAAVEDLRRQDVTLERFVWSKSARYLYFEGRSSDARGIWRVEIEPRTLAWKSAPERLSTGPAEYSDLAISADATRLAFTVRHDRTRVWSFPFAPEAGALTGEGQPVTPGGPAEYDAAAPLDGSRVAYRTVRGGRQELWQRSASGGNERLLASSAGATRSSPRWSRDGMRLAYLRSNVNSLDSTVVRAVAIMPAGGGAEQLLTLPPDAEVVPDDWSSDGSWILAACRMSARQPLGTCLMPSTGGNIHDVRVVAADPTRNLMCQRFSPDERWISFMAVTQPRTDVSTIYVMPAAGGPWIAVTAGDSYDDKPRWSPDGRVLYFLSPRDGALNLWGRRFDPERGTTVGDAFRVTSFHGTGHGVARELGRVEIAISSNRLFLPITESAGTIWMLEGVDR